MPIYEYVCNDCNTEFEVLVMTEDETTCPVCESKSVKKQISTFGFSTRSGKPACASNCGGGSNGGTCSSGMCCGG